ncbi:MAG: hypothetical protein RIE52_10970 [Balneola sp.]|jgi:hypothetical protein
MEPGNFVDIILAAGALGTASFGIVEGLKWTRLGTIGFSSISNQLGKEVMDALKNAYGQNFLVYLKSLYRENRSSGALSKTIRQGVRIGLSEDNAIDLAKSIGVVDGDSLKDVAKTLNSNGELSTDQRSILGRFELALDARIDSALADASNKYIGGMRLAASCFSIMISLATALTFIFTDINESFVDKFGNSWGMIVQAVIVGLVAVPIAPITKDIVSAIQAASKALKKS